MIMRTPSAAWHTAHILLFLLFRPAALFVMINALPWYRDTLRQWASSVVGDKPSTLLESGCATGELTHFLANLGHQIIGMDASHAMLAKAESACNSSAEFMHGSVMHLPFATGRFHHVIAASLINVVPDPVAALQEMARVCQGGGFVSVLVPQAGISGKRIAELANDLRLTGFSRAALLFWLHMARKLSRETLESYFLAAGLGNIRHASYLEGVVISVTGTVL